MSRSCTHFFKNADLITTAAELSAKAIEINGQGPKLLRHARLVGKGSGYVSLGTATYDILSNAENYSASQKSSLNL
jgi:hypothetical protein